jgi:hypothetical protein
MRFRLPRPRAEAVLGQRGHVAVVVEDDGQPEPGGQIVAHREVADVDHRGGHVDIALVKQNERRHAEADAQHIAACELVPLHELPHALDHQLRKLRPVRLDGRRLLEAVDQLIFFVKKTIGHLGAAGVDADPESLQGPFSSRFELVLICLL